MQKNKLISIGNLSKLTGVHIKSLRYYDRIGILKPAYVNPQTGYRFYTFQQLGIVEAIQTCLKLDIPLKDFPSFLSKSGGCINYTNLLEHGKEIAKKKIQAIQNGLALIDEWQTELHRTEIYEHTLQPHIFDMPVKNCYIEPFTTHYNSDELYNRLGHLLLKLQNQALKRGYEFGVIYRYSATKIDRFLFVDLLGEIDPSLPDILVLPADKYACKKIEESSIENAPQHFEELFLQDTNRTIIETELFTGDFNFSKPVFELRCSL